MVVATRAMKWKEIVDEENSEHEEDDVDEVDDIVRATALTSATLNYNTSDEMTVRPLHTVATNQPIYSDDFRGNFNLHILLNDLYNVLKRKYRKHSGSLQQNLLQHFVGQVDTPAVPLLFPESNVLPTTFWCLKNNSPIGSMDQETLSSTGQGKAIRSLRSKKDLIRIRLRDHDLTFGCLHVNIHYLFDLHLNDKLNRSSSAMVFKRGLEHLAESKTLNEVCDDGALPFGQYDSNVRVRELAALTKKYTWRYWVTLTCNEKKIPGLRKIMEAIQQNVMKDVEDETYGRLYDANLTIINRCWMRFVKLFLEYMAESPDQLFGPVRHIFARLEFQSKSSAGNKAHVHIGIALFDEPLAETLSRVSCNPLAVFHDENFGVDKESLLEKGIINDESEFEPLCQLYTNLSTHDCNKAGGRCLKRRNKDGELICRVPSHPNSRLYTFECKENLYSHEMLERLCRIGMAEKMDEEVDESVGNKISVTDERLRGGRFHYPTIKPPTYLPTIPIFQLALGSCVNVAVCDLRFATSYLLKYHVGKESHGGDVKIKETCNENEVNVGNSDDTNIKISGQKIIKEKMEENKPNEALQATEIGLFEIITYLENIPYTYSTVKFVHMSTLPPEYRVWRTKSAMEETSRFYGSTAGQSPFVTGRLGSEIPRWRRFTTNQINHANEYSRSTLQFTNTERFNIRPPELLFVNKLQLYHEIFTYCGKQKKSEISAEALNDPLVDACGSRIKIRKSGITKLSAYLHSMDRCGEYAENERSEESVTFIAEVLNKIKIEENKEEKPFTKRFVDLNECNEAIAVCTTVYPNRAINFIYSLIITLGRYETELDVFSGITSFKEAFQRVGLVADAQSTTEEDAIRIFKMYMDEQGLALPIGRNRFERTSKKAEQKIKGVFLDTEDLFDNIPPITELAVRQEAEDNIKKVEGERRKTLVETLFTALTNSGMANLPTSQQVIQATLLNPVSRWFPNDFYEEVQNGNFSNELLTFLPRAVGQTEESAKEQIQTLMKVYGALKNYKTFDPNVTHHKFPALIGPPGTGKTFLMEVFTYLALSEGFNCCIMALTSERARALGGCHIHELYPMEVTHGREKSTELSYTNLVRKLKRNGQKMVLLQRNDVFLIEEAGLISAEIFAILDSAMREINNIDSPFGGKFLMISGDPLQLPPPQGMPFWTSIHIIPSFKVHTLKEYVRAAGDPLLQEVLSLMRNERLSHEELERIIEIVKQECNFVGDWKDIPNDAMRVVSTRKAEQVVINEFLESKRNEPGVEIKVFAGASEVTSGQSWSLANRSEVTRISKHVLEPEELQIFKGEVMRLTYNKTHGSIKFSQGQLCIVEEIVGEPNEDEAAVVVRIIPPGVRIYNNANQTWPTVTLKRQYSQEISLSQTIHGRRFQLPLRYYKANTIHRIMGETCAAVATEINNHDHEKRHLRLWEKSQILVLLSRVRELSSLYFVGGQYENDCNYKRDANKKRCLAISYPDHVATCSRPNANIHFAQ